ncbi:hypothetical protein ACJVDH_05590 [Pedobacter sp. AW1-32]|uniref:hypothetical protein n=1 Tax=Pedobacter sp. AW1-32 TaxID=3383026 RepID=UPI003FED8A3A
MYKIIKLIIAMTFILFVRTQAQTVNMPPTPDAASLVNNVDRPISRYTGTPQIDLPIWSIGLKTFNLPIGLSYNAVGVKVEEEASNVGLNWSLNATFVITRAVKDIPDDYNKGGEITGRQDRPFDTTPSSEHPRLGRFWSGKYGLLKDFDDSNTDASYVYNSIRNIKANYGSFLLDGRNDLEPDVFYFSILGKSGKFVFDVDGNIQKILMLPYQDINISHKLNSEGEIVAFEITDNDGTRYIFDQVERLERITASVQYPKSSSPDGNGNFPERTEMTAITRYNSSWYVSQIISPTHEEIKFTYADESLDQFDRPNSTGVTGKWINGSTYNTVIADNSGRNKSTSKKRLTKIETEDETVNFIASELRKDTELPSFAITSIQVIERTTGQMIKGFNLTYDYFQSPLAEPLNGMSNVFVPLTGSEHPSYYRRLRLDRLQEISENGVQNPHLFIYDESAPLPNRFSYQQDIWGYFNGASSNQNLFPTLFIYPKYLGNERFRVYPICNVYPYNDNSVLPGANRMVDILKIKVGSLTSIIYPTGGHSDFEFESNQFLFDGCVYNGGGIRIKSVKNYVSSDANEPSKITNYAYHDSEGISSGRIIAMPVFAGKTLAEFFFYNSSQVALGNSNGSYVGYTIVTERNEGLTDNGTIKYIYSMPAVYNQTSDVEYGIYHSSKINWFDDQYYINDPVYLEYKNSYHLMPNTLPYPPNPDYDWNRGKLIKQIYFDEIGQAKKEITNTYAIYSAAAWKGNKKVFGLVHGSIGEILLYSKYEVIVNYANVLTSVTTKYYHDVNNEQTSKTSYNYASTGHMKPVEIIDENSSDVHNVTKFIYPHDYSISTPLPIEILTLKNKNIISEPVESLNYLENNGTKKLLGGQIKEFKIIEDQIVCDKVYEVETDIPITDFVESSTYFELFNKDRRYKEHIAFDHYDSKGNVLQLTAKGGIKQSFIWDSKKHYLMGYANNANINDIAFTGFEHEGNGGWSYSGTVMTESNGNRYLSLPPNGSGSINKMDLDPSKTYVVYMHYKDFVSGVPSGFTVVSKSDHTGWLICKAVISGSNAFSFQSIDCWIDNVQILPINAQITTYTYKPLVGMTSQTDPKGMTTYYEYDDFGRLKWIKDQNGNIVKENQYHYKN